jgi:ribosomal protein S18 acetylase RimI-like enzyme
VELRELSRADVTRAAIVAARALRDNPTSIAVFDGDPGRRERRLETLCQATLAMRRRITMMACREGVVVGVASASLPGACSASFLEQVRLLPFLLRDLPSTMRMSQQQLAWARWHPRERHYHLGPVAVEPALQRRGIGRQMMAALCARLDATREAAYLETDTPANVRFYEEFGFVTLGNVEVLGAATWFMRRPPPLAGALATP